MSKQVFGFYYLCFGLFCGSLRLFAEGEDFSDKDKPFSHRAEKGVDSEKPSRLTFSGSMETMSFIGSSSTKNHDNFGDDKKVVNNVLGVDFKSTLGFLWEFTPFTGANLKLKTGATIMPKDEFFTSPELSISLKEFVAYSDIARELGSEYLSTKLSVGRVGFGRKSFSVADVMGAKLSSRHSQSDQLNATLELGTRNTFPIKLVLASDLDFGINRKYSKLDWNNKGSSYLVDLQSANFKIADVMTLNWNSYYGYSRTPTKDHYLENLPGIGKDDKAMMANYLNKFKNTVGATVGASMPIGDLITISASGAVEYNSWKFVGPSIPAPVVVALPVVAVVPAAPVVVALPVVAAPSISADVSSLRALKGQNFGSLEWHVGVKMALKKIMTVSLAARQDVYNHVEYASLNKRTPHTEFITGLAVDYEQLKEMTKMTFHLGTGVGFGSLFSSQEYKRARHGVDTKIYSGYALNDKKKAAIKGIANPSAGNQLSADFAVGYHPVPGASIYLGYQYGRYALKGSTKSDFDGSPGHVYLSAKYSW